MLLVERVDGNRGRHAEPLDDDTIASRAAAIPHASGVAALTPASSLALVGIAASDTSVTGPVVGSTAVAWASVTRAPRHAPWAARGGLGGPDQRQPRAGAFEKARRVEDVVDGSARVAALAVGLVEPVQDLRHRGDAPRVRVVQEHRAARVVGDAYDDCATASASTTR